MSVNRVAAFLDGISSPSIPAATTAALLSIVIVNYRRWPETAQLVEQLVRGKSLFRDRVEVLVIDNHSPEPPSDRRWRKLPGVRILQMDRNRGFSAGVNEGMRRTRAPWLLVMNPDLAVAPEFVDQVCATALDFDSVSLDGAPVGVVGFQLRNRDCSRQHSAGWFPTLGRMIGGLFRRRRVRKYGKFDSTVRQRVPWVTGSCMLIRRSCLKRLGGFDESFFLYYEDVDFCRRAEQVGWAVCYEPTVQAVHLDPLQNRQPTAALRAITRHAALNYFRKHLPGRPSRWLSRIIRAEAWLRQKWAKIRGRRNEAVIFRKLRGLCRDLDRRQLAKARERLAEIIEFHSGS